MLVSGSGSPPPGNGFTKSAKPRHWVGFSFKIKKIAPALGRVVLNPFSRPVSHQSIDKTMSQACFDGGKTIISTMLDKHWLGTEEYVNLHRNQVSPALGRIFITYDLPRIWVGNL